MDSRISVLFLEHYPKVAGGQQSLLTLLKYIDRDRFAPSVLCGDEGEAFYDAVSRISDTTVYTASLNPPDVAERSDTRVFQSLRKIVHNIVPAVKGVIALVGTIRREKPDVVHCNTFKMAVFAAIVSLTFWQTAFVYHARTSRENANHGWLDWFVIWRMDAVIANSEYTRESFSRFDEKFDVIHSPIDFDELDPESTEFGRFRSALGLDDEAVLVCTVGRIAPVKRYEDFVRAATLVTDTVDDVHFAAVGGEGLDTDYVESVHELVAEASHSDRITIYGYHDTIAEVYADADVLVHCATMEAMGRVIVEAQYFGLPVVAADSGGVREIVRDGESGHLVEPKSPAATADKVRSLVDDPGQRRRFGECGVETVKHRFAAPAITRQHEDLFARLGS